MSVATLLLLVVSLAVGISIGAVGIGGILLIPALGALGGLGVHRAMATALFTFFFTGLVGALMFQRRGSIRWKLAMPLSLGALCCGSIGAWANSRMDGAVLTLILAAIIALAGLYTLRSHHGERIAPLEGRPAEQAALLGAIGAFVGFGSGLTGVGGPAIAVPLMVMSGFAPLATIGASQVVQVVASISATAANVGYGNIDYAIALPVTVAQLAGVPLGVRIVHSIDARLLHRAVALLCIAVGAWLAIRVLAS
ncbi:MAG TPA: sulfite exporter TauE/SafE family protein [Usitatibacter sp.]|nr:sulfite exporter TauE/SafE family protein [Usitatibacter sp.]